MPTKPQGIHIFQFFFIFDMLKKSVLYSYCLPIRKNGLTEAGIYALRSRVPIGLYMALQFFPIFDICTSAFCMYGRVIYRQFQLAKKIEISGVLRGIGALDSSTKRKPLCRSEPPLTVPHAHPFKPSHTRKMSLIPEYVRRALRNTPGLGLSTFKIAGAAAKPRPINLGKRVDDPERETDWVVLHLAARPKAAEAPVATPLATETKKSFNWTLRSDAAHTCAGWDPAEEDDPWSNSPYNWCPACRYADEQRHKEASRLAAAAPAVVAAPLATAVARTPTTIQVNAFQKAMIEAGGATGCMIRDSLIGGGKYMRSWADYCLMDDPHFLDFKELTEEERKRLHRPAPRSAAAPMRSVRVRGGGSAEEREAETRAWLATPRNKRQPFHKGALVAGKDCMPKDNSIIIANILNDSQTAYGDLRQLLSDHGVLVDMYRPAKPGAPMFAGFHTEGDVAKVIAAFPEGIRYNGRLLPIERAIARSKTGAQMAKISAAGGGGGGRQ